MSTFDITSKYYSGQGVVMLAERDANGAPKGFTPVGNCTDLKISVSTSVLEHKESQTGQRAIDKRLITETKAALSMTLEHFSPENLARALKGSVSSHLASAVTNEAPKGYLGKVHGLSKIKVSSVVLSRGAQALTAYTNDTTAYDYKLNADAGSFQLNDGSVVAVDKLTTGGTVPSAITVSTGAGLPTQVTVANTAVAGDYVVFTGFTGADAGLVNGKAFKITSRTAAYVFIDVDTYGKTITLGTPLSYFDGTALDADFSYATQKEVNALTEGTSELYMRFEGLNTMDTNAPVIVEIFRFEVDPLKELLLIGEGVQQFVLDGNVLADSSRSTGSKFFKEMMQ